MMLDKLRELFSFPVPVDVQLDVLDDGRGESVASGDSPGTSPSLGVGTLSDVLGISLTTGIPGEMRWPRPSRADL